MTGLRILVVDDNQDAMASLAILLKTSGHQVETASDGLTGVAAAERYRPDLMLLDIGLPGLDGYSVCRRIRAQSWGQAIHIVALTGWGQDEDRRRAQAAGFDGHLVKPVALATLQQLLKEILAH
jgi:CheY-like chemotaxis protein